MRRVSALLFCAAACVSLAFGQQPVLKGYTTTLPLKEGPANAAGATVTPVTPLPMWTYSIVAGSALGGGTYTGTVVGRSPANRGKTTTTIPTQIVPLIITITNATAPGNSPTTFTYDPTAVDACVSPGTHTGVEVITSSPIFTNNNWVMNGVNVGNTQYIDAFQRAEFWSQLAGTPYHLMLQQSVLPAQTLTFNTALGHTGGSSGPGGNYSGFGTCPTPLGVVNVDDLDAAIVALITGPLASMVNPGTFPIFLTRNVVSASPGVSLSNCCILGYHSGFTSGGNLQIYSPFSLDTAGVFGPGFVTTLSHEMGEAINDPMINNLTPLWGGIGQQPGCQNNLEVGDPLSPGGIAPTSNSFVVAGANGLSYELQEMAFFNWFFGSPAGPVGTGGKFSNNGTLSGFAKLCPPGGTN